MFTFANNKNGHHSQAAYYRQKKKTDMHENFMHIRFLIDTIHKPSFLWLFDFRDEFSVQIS
jgi:hypothetical protein